MRQGHTIVIGKYNIQTEIALKLWFRKKYLGLFFRKKNEKFNTVIQYFCFKELQCFYITTVLLISKLWYSFYVGKVTSCLFMWEGSQF